jgi:signal transduction histidine kinase
LANDAPFGMQAHVWAGFNRVTASLVVAVSSSAMRAQRAAMQARLAALERSRELEEEILRVSEREQMRLGQDLHDGLCQHLAAIDCAVACLKHDLEERGLPEAGAANFIQEQLTSAIGEARDMARGVFPVQIDEEGFLAALEELTRMTNRLRQVSVTLGVQGEIKIKDPQTGMHLYRIAQEALNNVAKHARASRVHISLHRTDHRLDMSIVDNGSGFIPEKVNGRGLGMQTMRYRAKSLGGELHVTGGPEGGSAVHCTVPMEDAAPALINP